MSELLSPGVVAELIAVRGRAYAPYSTHPVGAMVESASGARYFGANVETRIHVVDAEGKRLKGYTIDELLPDAFGPENLVS